MALSTRETSRPTVGATRARQGRPGRHVLWVLVFGLLLVILGFVAAYAWKADDLASTGTDSRRSAATSELFTAPEPAPINSAVEGNDAPDNLAPAGGQQPTPSSPPS